MKIKIFGERNTGTNALRKLLKSNSSSIIHPGTMNELDSFAVRKTSVLKMLSVNRLLIENIIDNVFTDRPVEETWKHSATNFENMELPHNTHFVFMLRHPISWLYSLYKNPYHILVEKPDTLLKFHDVQWKTLRRDNLIKGQYTPSELYQEKIYSYVNFIKLLNERQISYSILKLEDLILDQRSCFEKLCVYLDCPNSEFEFLQRSTKDSKKSLEYYQTYYGEERWRSEVGGELLRRFDFDSELLGFMGYDL